MIIIRENTPLVRESRTEVIPLEAVNNKLHLTCYCYVQR